MITRRGFIKNTLLGIASATVPIPLPLRGQVQKLGTAVGSVALTRSSSGDKPVTTNLIVSANLDERTFSTSELGFYCHSVIPASKSRTGANIGLGVERLGPHAALIDIQSAKALREVLAPKNRFFYGHAAVNAEGTTAYLSTVEFDPSRPIYSERAPSFYVRVSMLDLQSMKVVRESSILGLTPHDVKMSLDGKSLFVPVGQRTNGKSAIVVLNPTDLREIASLDVDSHGSLAHIHVGQSGLNIATQNVEKSKDILGAGPLHFWRSTDSVPTTFSLPSEITDLRESHLLSICGNTSGTLVATTCPAHDRVFFFDIKKQSLLKAASIKFPTGVTLSADRRFFVVASLDGFRFYNQQTAEEESRFAWKIPLLEQPVDTFFRHAECIV